MERPKPIKVTRSRRRGRENDPNYFGCPKPTKSRHSYVPNRDKDSRGWHRPPSDPKGLLNYSRTPYKKERRRERRLLRDLHNSVGWDHKIDTSRNLYRSLFCLYYKIFPLLMMRLPGRVDFPKLTWVESRLWEDLQMSHFLRKGTDVSPTQTINRLRGFHRAKIFFYKKSPQRAKALMSPPPRSGQAVSGKSSRRK